MIRKLFDQWARVLFWMESLAGIWVLCAALFFFPLQVCFLVKLFLLQQILNITNCWENDVQFKAKTNLKQKQKHFLQQPGGFSKRSGYFNSGDCHLPDTLHLLDVVKLTPGQTLDAMGLWRRLPAQSLAILLCVAWGQASYLNKGMKDRAEMYNACRGGRHFHQQTKSVTGQHTDFLLPSQK